MNLYNMLRSAWADPRKDISVLVKRGQATVGAHTYGNPTIHTFTHDNTRLTIGSYTSIARGVTIVLGGYHPMDRVTTFPLRLRLGLDDAGVDGYPWSPGNISIGSDVWIGTNATILSGVTIGHGAVVAAGALVNRDVAPYTVVAGNPARELRSRLREDLIGPMLEIAWWNWPDETVRNRVAELSSANVAGFVEAYSRTEVIL
jgi:acetyltransferase-like isoleucine patch superfamily enzyme